MKNGAPVGKRIVIFNQYADGLLVIEKEKFIRNKHKASCLLDIWTPGKESKYELFISEAIRNGVVDEHTMQWMKHEAVSLIWCYKFLSCPAVGLVQSDLDWTEVYQAFSGTFVITKPKGPRSLQDRKNKTRAYFTKEKEWKQFFFQRFFFAEEPTKDE